jgi:hypothetical protein
VCALAPVAGETQAAVVVLAQEDLGLVRVAAVLGEQPSSPTAASASRLSAPWIAVSSASAPAAPTRRPRPLAGEALQARQLERRLVAVRSSCSPN